MTPHGNSQWIGQVNRLLREGLGVEDIAIRLKCDVEAVRVEVAILREMVALDDMFSPVNDQSRPEGRP